MTGTSIWVQRNFVGEQIDTEILTVACRPISDSSCKGAQVVTQRNMVSTFDCSLPACLIAMLVGWSHLQCRAGAACPDGAIDLTAYWMPYEGQADVSSSGAPIVLDGPRTRDLVDISGSTIARVAEVTFQRCKEEGACYLIADTGPSTYWVVRYVGGGNVFERLDMRVSPYGLGGWNNNLHPFVSVGTSAYPPGTKLYIKELDGLELQLRVTGDRFHNGCVRVDDVAPSEGPCSLRLFAFVYYYYKRMGSTFSIPVHVEERSTCKILDFH